MQRITKIQTLDGKLHDSVKDAKKHLNSRLEDQIGRHVDKLCNIVISGGGYKSKLELYSYLEANLTDFVVLHKIKADLTLQDENEDE